MDDDSYLGENDTTTTFPRAQLLNLTNDASSSISPLEQEVLDEYSRLLNNMNEVSQKSGALHQERKDNAKTYTSATMSTTSTIFDQLERTSLLTSHQLTSTLQDLSSGPITLEIAESLRLLERKVASVYTLMKASVYSIVLQQGQVDATQLDDGEATQITVMR